MKQNLLLNNTIYSNLFGVREEKEEYNNAIFMLEIRKNIFYFHLKFLV